MENKLRYMGGIVCESSAIDQETQHLSAFRIVDQINVNLKSTDPTISAKSLEKITVPLTFQVISLWKRKNQADMGKDLRVKVSLEIVDPNAEVLAKQQIEFVLPLDKIRSRTLVNIQGMPVSTTGEYCIRLREIDEKNNESEPLATLCFDVIVNKE